MVQRDDYPFAAQRRSGGIQDTKYWRLQAPAEDFLSFGSTAIGAQDRQALAEAAEMLAGGATVAFPTETVYGLGADARNTAAVEAVFAAKGRPSDNPLIVHIADREALDPLVTEVSPVASALIGAFWPGPLTLVLPVRPGVLSPLVTAGLDTVGVRMPAHGVAQALIREAGCPVAAPSANRSGRPSPTAAGHVRGDLAGYIGGVLDGGPAGVGLESTVVQVQPDGTAVILRPGGITAEQLAAVLGPGAVSAAPGGEAAARDAAAEDSPAPRAPGMKYTHYAPRGWLGVVRGATPQRVAEAAAARLAAAALSGETTGLLLFEEHRSLYPAHLAACVRSLGALASPEEGARALYAALRDFDDAGATYILAEACPETGLGAAIMNRLMKAAGGTVIEAGE